MISFIAIKRNHKIINYKKIWFRCAFVDVVAKMRVRVGIKARTHTLRLSTKCEAFVFGCCCCFCCWILCCLYILISSGDKEPWLCACYDWRNRCKSENTTAHIGLIKLLSDCGTYNIGHKLISSI